MKTIRPLRKYIPIMLVGIFCVIQAPLCHAHGTAKPVCAPPVTTPVIVTLSQNNGNGTGCANVPWTIGNINTVTTTCSVGGTCAVTAGFNLMVQLIANCSATLTATTTLTASQTVTWSSTAVFQITPCTTDTFVWTSSVTTDTGTISYGHLLWHREDSGAISAYSASGTGVETTTQNSGCPACG
jgi:hypothetical protein